MIRLLRYWLQRAKTPERFELLAGLLPIEAQSRQEVLQKQRREFAEMAAFAARHTDYYAHSFGQLIDAPGRSPVPEDLPILHKQDVIENIDRLLRRDVDLRRVKNGHTGGSTGKPLAFYYDDHKHELMLAGMMRGFMMSGWRPGQRILYFWGASRDVSPSGVFAAGQGGFFGVEKTVAAVEFSEARLNEWVNLIRNWRPVLLYGYASALTELARFIVDTKIDLPKTPLGVYSTAEVLNDWQRELMQQAFGCKVFNQYGCREVPNIAWECRHGNMHIFTDMVYMESVPLEGEDRLVVTSLTNRLMPFIRYDIGDTGRLLDGECACGLPFPLMEMDVCRHNDLIRARGGRLFHPAYFNRLLYGLGKIQQYQWVQAEPDRMVLNLVADERLSGQTLATIASDIQRDVDAQMRLEVNYLEEIPRNVSGKHRFVIGLDDESSRPATVR